MSDDLVDRALRDGHSYEDYRAHWRTQKEASPESDDPDERRLLHFLNYNWERQAHVHDTYTPSDELREAVEALDTSQCWMVLTEPWCGDSAFLLPVIAEAAARSEHVTLRILLRDNHLDVMDQYLTDGSRSIPKLVVFSEDGAEQFVWGPRPDGARRRFAELSAEHDDKMTVIKELVAYYEDGGWREADDELATALRDTIDS